MALFNNISSISSLSNSSNVVYNYYHDDSQSLMSKNKTTYYTYVSPFQKKNVVVKYYFRP